MIKKVLGFVTIGNVSVLMAAMIGVYYLFIKRFELAILYLLLAIAILFINVLFRKYGEALKLAEKCNDNERVLYRQQYGLMMSCTLKCSVTD